LAILAKEKQLPDLDDEFASEVSDFDTMSEYREDVQKKLTSKKEEEELLQLPEPDGTGFSSVLRASAAPSWSERSDR